METLTIGQLSKISQVSADTIRFYEKLRLVIPRQRSRSGYRLYDEGAVLRLVFIRKAKALGFTLSEIKKLLSLSTARTAHCEEMLEMTNTKIQELREQTLDLSRMRKILSRLAEDCPGGPAPTSDCPILDFLRSPYEKLRMKSKARRR